MDSKYLELYNEIFNDSENHIELKNKYLSYNNSKKIDKIKISIIKLLDADYVTFYTNRFTHFSLFGNSLNYFKKSKIVCINFYIKNIVLQKLNEINNIIKNYDDKTKNKLKKK
jgi:hypothetical protein